MFRVGVFAPYCRSEVTLAATQFADWLIALGFDVSFLAEGKVNKGVHPVWDNRVVRYKNSKSVYRWACGATHLCWFSPNIRAFEEALVVLPVNQKKFTRQFYFPSWHNWNKDSATLMGAVGRVICLSRDMFMWLKDEIPITLFNSVFQDKRTWGNLVDPSVVYSPRLGFMDNDTIRLLTILPRTVYRDIGCEIFELFEFLLASYEDLKLTLLLEASWPKLYRRKVNKLLKTYGSRLNVIQSPPYYEYSYHIRNNDWVYVCSTRHSFGSLLSMVASDNVPVIAHDVPPVGGHFQDKVNAKLIRCELAFDSYPVARVAVDDIAEGLDSALCEDSVGLEALQLQAINATKRRQTAFKEMIEKEFIG